MKSLYKTKKREDSQMLSCNINAENLRGQKFNSLVPLEIDEKRYIQDLERKEKGEIVRARVHWICQCDCGKKTTVSASHLKQLKQKTCGLCYTFEDWCKDNNKTDLLSRWDEKLNSKTPSQVNHRASSKYYFKCPQKKHKSMLFCIASLTNNTDRKVSCLGCNSLGEYLLKSFGNLSLWGASNTVSPFEVNIQSNKKFYFKCSQCNVEKLLSPNTFYSTKTLGCVSCSDNISIPEKFLREILLELGVGFEFQYSPSWANGRRYDFYIPLLNCVIETHGTQHYSKAFHTKNNAFDLKAQETNDYYKSELAKKNGINHYVELDCRKSTLDWIKTSILKSEIPNLLNLVDIDWEGCFLATSNSLMIRACNLWNSNMYLTAREVALELSISTDTVRQYLKRGAEIKITQYNPKEELYKKISRVSKPVVVEFNGKFLGEFCSSSELCRVSQQIFGTSFSLSKVCECARGEIKSHKGYNFRYI